MSFLWLRSRASPKVYRESRVLKNSSPCVSRTLWHQHPLQSVGLPLCRRRYLTGGTNAPGLGHDLLRQQTSIEDIRLKTEFEENKDIREYLRKWQRTHSNSLDPVRGPGTPNELDPNAPWIGNMLNDNREAYDAGSDTMRSADEDVAEFSHDADDGEGIHDFLEPGDLVALPAADGILTFAIYVRSVYKQQQFYTERGKWRIAFPKDIDYVVKGFAPPELVAPLHPHLPDTLASLGLEIQSAIEGGVPRPVGAPLLRLIGDFDERVRELYQANAYRLDRIHEIVADADDKVELTLEELASKALGVDQDQLDNAILYTVHQTTRQNPFLIENDRSSLFADYYLVQPKRVAEVLETVTTWVHEHQEYLIRAVTGKEVPNLKDHPLQQFIQKAQRLIRLSRKVRSPTTMACVGPTAQRFQPGQEGNAMVYREVLTEKFTDMDRHGISRRSDNMWTDVEQACEKFNTESLSDRMQNTRVDWGELTIYCVDNADAQEIDDGVSLERIPGSEDTFWIRVHIANPSAFIQADDIIMEYAASRIQTLYVPERTYPMLPSSLTQKHFSLASGRPTLTFSAKMNLQGEVLSTEISNGIAQNVVYITHDKLRGIFEPETKGQLDTLTVGGVFPPGSGRETLQDTLSSEDENTFHILRKLMLAFRDHRRKNGAMEWPSHIDTPVSMMAGTASLNPSNMEVKEGRYYLGDPIIQLRPRSFDPHEIPDITRQNLISTLMNLACWVSGKWCADRNIPTVYDGTYYHPEYPRLTSQNMSEYGGQNWLQLSAPKGVSLSSPIHHMPLGLDVYVKSTSPLRRYTDLMAHYQIEAALRFEQEHGRQFDANTDSATLPFSREHVDGFIKRSLWKRNRLRDVDRASKQFWACMLLFRAFYFAECELPETFTCLLHKPYSATSLVGTPLAQGYGGMIAELGVRCQVMTSDLDVDILSTVEAKVTAVDLSRMVVIMEATRVVKPFERVGEWA
ncbi:hypothetical protein FE257_000132 [Aspergillus nanangensis]|uniref:RNB domain-containing protein n=1 Tax=Aspergillus nanangensis TaxID=2582783 RepID=A0AAD4CYU7_ASPNN|nr:hypothetical protein FE257_000132 [Aspergillus nanangensis]